MAVSDLARVEEGPEKIAPDGAWLAVCSAKDLHPAIFAVERFTSRLFSISSLEALKVS